MHITLSAFELLSSLAQLSMDHLGKEDLMYVVVEFYSCFKFYSSLSFFLGMVMYMSEIKPENGGIKFEGFI